MKEGLAYDFLVVRHGHLERDRQTDRERERDRETETDRQTRHTERSG